MDNHHDKQNTVNSRNVPYRQKRRGLVMASLAFSALFAANAIASSTTTQQEINHLLTFIEHSPCTYIRNGDDHTGAEAAKHIRRKYKHYRDEINTSEDFIRLSATQSALTGKKYAVQCPGQEVVPSSHWLTQELTMYRSQK